jgi:predicted aldo/keto reductase-like oxidoreductase
MIHNKYGSTGIDVSAIGFGGMRFENPQDIDTNAELVKAAYDVGINYIDTAPLYCSDKSEPILGAALKEMLKTRSRKPFYVSTKSMGTEPGLVRKDLEKSLKRLGLDYIDFYHFWCIVNLDDYYLRKKNGVLKEFEKLKEQGLIKHICISTHLPGTDIEKVLADYPFEGVLLGYSAMNFAYREAGLDAAVKSRRGVVVMNPLGGGIIPKNPEIFSFVKTQQDETVVQAALRFLLNDNRIDITLVGFSSLAQLDEAIAAVDGFKPIPLRAIEKIRESVKESFNQLCTGCRYCDKCPEGIPVPRMMDAYNHKMFSGKDKDIIDRLVWHWQIDLENNYLDKCTQCGLCEEACTQRLPIRQRLAEMRRHVQKFVAEEKKKKTDATR